MASHPEKFLLANSIINPSVQKGFLSGIPGAIKHIFTTSAILSNVIEYELLLYKIFLDVSNTFGSIPYGLINVILNLIKVPSQVIEYITYSYSQLAAFVSCAEWSTQQFQIQRGVFQGDTLFPLIFLIAFNPVITLSNSNQASGFSLHLPVPSSDGLPPVGPTSM